MHMGYLVRAVRDVIRDALDSDSFVLGNWRDDEIDIMPDGKPPPWIGDKFIAVYGTDWAPAVDDTNVGLDAYLGVACTLTYRSPRVPQSKIGNVLYADLSTGMSEVCWRIMKSVAMQGSSTTEVPLFTKLAAIPGFTANSFSEYLRWKSTDPSPVPVYAEWFTAVNQNLDDPLGLDVMGYTMTVRFGDARTGLAFI